MFIIGRPLPPPETVRKMAMTLTGRAIELQEPVREVRGVLVNGVVQGLQMWTYRDPDMEAIRAAIMDAQVVQAGGVAAPSTGRPLIRSRSTSWRTWRCRCRWRGSHPGRTCAPTWSSAWRLAGWCSPRRAMPQRHIRTRSPPPKPPKRHFSEWEK